jgi:trans-AT polyketide synthase/acyltransferase/oxidoreductase domain-containing protein
MDKPAIGDAVSQPCITAESLGSPAFKSDYGLRYAYIAGAMYKGISSPAMVIALGRADLLGYLGTGGMRFAEIEAAIQQIQSALPNRRPYGLNLLYNPAQPAEEMRLVDLYLRYQVRHIEAAAYMQITPALVRFRLSGLHRDAAGRLIANHRILAKISRPEVAEAFMRPAPKALVQALLTAGRITSDQAEFSQTVPMSEDICVEADSGGHTDQGVAYALMPTMRRLGEEIMREYGYAAPLRIGAAGGIGTPEAAMAAFMLGADFILTGSINQCSVEAGTSDEVKNLLQDMNVQDTDYAPAGDMFELGAKVQVLKKGVFFPSRANKLYALYQHHDSLDALDPKIRTLLEKKYFKRSFESVWAETKRYYQQTNPRELEKAARLPKHKMALIFKWYFVHSTRLAMRGSEEQRVDYQVPTGPALGAFNQWVKGTDLASWRNRHVVDMADKLMQGAAVVFNRRIAQLISQTPAVAAATIRRKSQ